jgi:multidrug efflux pump
MIFVTLGTMAFTAYLYVVVPKGFLPQQDTGRASGSIQADQDTSFQAMSTLMQQYCKIVAADPAVDGVIAFTGGGGPGGTVNTGNMFVTLKPISVRKMTIDQVDARLTRAAARIPGGSLLFRPAQDINIGGRNSRAQYQYTLQGDNLDDLITWAPQVQAAIHDLPGVTDVNSDQQNRGLEAYLQTDRSTAQRLGISAATMDTTLGDAFGQAQVSTMYTPLNQYHVVMEVQPSYWQSPNGLKYIYVPGTNNTQVPLASFTKYEPLTTSLSVNHQSQFPAITLSFNLVPGVALGQVVTEINKAEQDIGLPATIHGSFQGTAQQYQAAQANQPLLIAAAILAVYLVLGMLYESFIHPITILSTLPSAGVGALMALIIFKVQLDVMGMIGIILLIGIVKKNAIMMIDFALMTERTQKVKPVDAIFQACLLRFRPISMTTMAALLGGLPLAIGMGTGSELRRPLGIAIVGGLIFSQMLTLYTTPVVYLYLDRFRLWTKRVLTGDDSINNPQF